MLFRKDFFAVLSPLAATPHSDAAESVRLGLDMGIELFNNGDWADALELIGDYVPWALAATSPSAVQESVLSLAAVCNARLASSEGRWGAAADWLLTAMARCRPENEPAYDAPVPYQYLLASAVMASDERIFSYQPTQLHVVLNENAFHDLALAYVRLLPFGDARQVQAINAVVPLRNRILEHLWKDRDLAKSLRRGEADIVELAYQRILSLFNEISEKSHQIGAQIENPHLLRDAATSLIQTLARGTRMLLTEEQKAADQLRELLGRELTSITQVREGEALAERRGRFDTFLAHASDLIGRLERGGLFCRTVCLPPTRQLRELAIREVGVVESALAPSLILTQKAKRYPLDQVGETIRLQIEVTNQGQGVADSCQVDIQVPRGCALAFGKPMPLTFSSLPPGRSTNIDCPVRLNAAAASLALPVTITYTDVFGNRFSQEEPLVVERQRDEPDWDALINCEPYSLKPVTSLERLRGRAALLDTLKVNAALGMSTVVWGQKRVGKTSIARVFELEVADKALYLPIYVRRGSVAGYGEGKIAWALASMISAAVTELGLEVPEETWFGPYLTRLTEWIQTAKRSGLSSKLIIILDEFDEINPAIYLGQRGANFFSTLRDLSDEHVVWVFVGSERMHSIFLRHHASFNKYETCRVDRVTDPRDIHDMIVGPVRDMIEWAGDAIDSVRQISAGNPYYVHLLCLRVLKAMYGARRTFVDRSDVIQAAEEIVSPASPEHWGHFWEENTEIDPSARSELAARSALLLAAIGSAGGSSVLGRAVIEAALASFEADAEDISSLPEILPDLIQRGVLQEVAAATDIRYQVVVPLFGEFLAKHCRSVVFPFYPWYKSTVQEGTKVATVGTASMVHVNSFPVEEEDLLSISEGLTYQGKPVDAVRIRSWLRQFPDEAAILVGYQLVRSLKERYYYDRLHVSQAIDDGYKWLVEQMRLADVPLIEVGGGTGRKANVCVAYLGLASKSGADVAREFKTQKRFAKCVSAEEALEWVKEAKLRPEQKFVLIVDDFVGSGGQATRDFLGVVNKLRKDLSLLEWAELGRLLFVPLWAYADGVHEICSEVGDLVRVHASRNLDDEDRAFSSSSRIFETDDERRYPEDVFRHIGQQLERDRPLGHGDCQALVVFENTVPNNTLPPFWDAGNVDEKPWVPLFPRP